MAIETVAVEEVVPWVSVYVVAGKGEALGQVDVADAIGPRSYPHRAGAAAEAEDHLGGGGQLHADVVILLDREPSGLVELGDHLLGTGRDRRAPVIADKVGH